MFDELVHCAVRGILTLAALVWFYLEMCFHSWPYSLVMLTHDDLQVRQATADQFYKASECCLSKSFCLQVRSMAEDAPALLRNLRLRAALRAWRDTANIANIHAY